MEIRRVEPELITPPTAGDHSARVELERKTSDKGKGRRKHQQTSSGLAEEGTHNDEQEPEAASTTVYDPGGHLQTHETPGHEPHTIDFTV